MMRFMIRALDASFRVDVEALVPAIQRRWPGTVVNVRPVTDRYVICDWSLGQDGEAIRCVLRKKHQALWLEERSPTWMAWMARVAVWYRAVVPPGQQLVLQRYSAGLHPQTELTGAMTEQAVIDFLVGAVVRRERRTVEVAPVGEPDPLDPILDDFFTGNIAALRGRRCPYCKDRLAYGVYVGEKVLDAESGPGYQCGVNLSCIGACNRWLIHIDGLLGEWVAAVGDWREFSAGLYR